VSAIRVFPVIRASAPKLKTDSEFCFEQELGQQLELHPTKAVEIVWDRLCHNRNSAAL
jgi:hypothetical protein